jgi:outer membrane protein OmpA-like peptidoglycan-associated protein
MEVQAREKIQFEKASSKLVPVSDAILDRVVNIVKETASIKHIEIRGFTSSEGIAAKNKALSQARAEAVMAYLIAHGIPKEKLNAKGFGPDNPIAPNDTEENREKNRRVTFEVEEMKVGGEPRP